MSAPGESAAVLVVAAIVMDGQGRVLIDQRPAGKPWAGYWEFPGGKVEAGEAPFAALQRELREELGLSVDDASAFMQFTYDYPERRVALDVWRVLRFSGVATSREGQALAWVRPDELSAWKLLPADPPIVQALCSQAAKR
ncbi:MAG: 8-oxo-dGTP diphosphatase MutT [Gammaproteobacteria bacterium]